ncbi:hypothetical protein D3C81_2191440 [compost metagenome]
MGKQLEYHLAGQQAQPRGLRLAQQAMQGGRQQRAGVRRRTVVQGDAAALVLEQNAGMGSGESMQTLADRGG